MQVRIKWMVVSLAAVALLVGAWMVQRGGAEVGGVRLLDGGEAGHGQANGWGLGGGDASPAVAVPQAEQVRTPEQVRQRLFREGSFAGTEPSGEWCVTTDKLLKPCKGLRGRFEYYILGLGEVSIAEIRGLIQDEARIAHGDKLATEITDLFDKYWKIRTYDWKNQFVQNDRNTWMPVFEEQRSVRRQLLGQAWAEAFYADDEKNFLAYFNQLESGQAPPPDVGEPVPQMAAGKDPAAVRAERAARYGEDAADRLEAVDKQWEEWDRRLAAARSEWERLKAANNLSDSQRQAEMQRYVDENFQDKDRIRAKALIKY
ncbi:MAG: lipase secretion chaperone [Pseudomonadota bacterium]